jgi:hypothetical protein
VLLLFRAAKHEGDTMAPSHEAGEGSPESASVPALVEENERTDHGIPVPEGLTIIGKVVHWEGCPNLVKRLRS